MTPAPIQLCNERPSVAPCPCKCAQMLHILMPINRPLSKRCCPTSNRSATIHRSSRPMLHPVREIVWGTSTIAYLTKFIQPRLWILDSPMASLVSTQECPTDVIYPYKSNRSTMSMLLQCLYAQQPRNGMIMEDSCCNTNCCLSPHVFISDAHLKLCTGVPDVHLRHKVITSSPTRNHYHPWQLLNESKFVSKTHLH